MFGVNHQDRRGFTLTEMLVVIGIIAILAALLLPAVNRAIYTARNAAIAVEVNQLATAIESYKQDKGDYPPNFGDSNVVLRHIRKCYPKADSTYITTFVTRACTRGQNPDLFIDEGESLVFWLSMTDNDPRYPFLSYYNPGSLPLNPKRYYDFDQTRLTPVAIDKVPSHRAKFCKETCYIYIDSRSYDLLTANFPTTANPSPSSTPVFAYADDYTVAEGIVRPYWSGNPATPGSSYAKEQTKPVNPTTFQVLCAGQDGDFGLFDGNLRSPADPSVKLFPSGLNYNQADKDNITNFSNGKTLADNAP